MVFFIFIKNLIEHSVSYQRSAASDLDLNYFPMPVKKDDRLILVKDQNMKMY